MALVEDYIRRIDYSKSAEAYIRENGFVTHVEDFYGETKEYLTSAAILLFGKHPQRFFQRARVRVIRYEGTEAKVGSEMNVIKDEMFEGAIRELTRNVLAFVRTQVKEHMYLGADGLFKTDEQYPEFCWTEVCVNAICHRDYSILGTDIQVKIFDDHITVESPGIFPGLVRPKNICTTHFSRNPKIAAYMHEYKMVKEYGEGVDRMYREMAAAGNPAPEFNQQDFIVCATIRENRKTGAGITAGINKSQAVVYNYIKTHHGSSVPVIADSTGIPAKSVERHMGVLMAKGLIVHKGSKRTGGYYPL